MLNPFASRRIITSLCTTIGLGLGVQGSHGQSAVEKGKIYWTNRGFGTQIQRADLDGSNVEDLVISIATPEGIALDLTEGKMYWRDRLGEIKRADLDGSNIEVLVTTGREAPQGIALDVAGGKMYWTNRDVNTIQRANLDGSDVEDLITEGLESPQSIALDVTMGKMYWTNRDANTIQRADLNGSNIENLLTSGVDTPHAIALDVDAGKMYWTEWGDFVIRRANLDGSNVENLIPQSEVGLSQGIVLDVDAGKMYWTGGPWGPDKIQRADLDGSNVEDFIPPRIAIPRSGIALDPTEGKIYWTDWSEFAIRRADLDGSNVENLLTSLSSPLSITLDAVGGKMYWAAYGQANGIDASSIYRADLDGSNVENVVGPKAGSREFILDVEGGKIYWQRLDIHPSWEGATDFILRADLDGSNVEVVASALSAERKLPGLLAISRGKMYWSGESTIYRTELDGSNAEVLVTVAPDGSLWIFLDIAGGKMYYWIEDNDSVSQGSKRISGIIRRTDLDGSNVEDLLDVVRAPWYFDPALEVVGGKIYWINSHVEDESYISTTILRADLDGSNVEVLVTGISAEQLILDGVGGKMYWTDWGRDYWSPDGTIQRANLDGSNIEILVTGLFSPSIALYIPHPVPTLVSTHNTVPETPTISRLEPNFPNPFNSTTQIPYRLAASGPVRLEIYNALGQPVRTLLYRFQDAGAYQVRWNARDQRGAAVAAGVYLVRLHHPGGVQTRRLLLLK